MYHSFDTHEVVKSFVKSGMKTELAETVVKAIAISRDTDFSHLATKADLVKLENKLEKRILEVESKLSNRISEVENKLSNRISEVESKLEKQILEVENRLEKKILESENRLEVKITSFQGSFFSALEKSKNETLRWVLGINIATISAVAAMLKFFI